MLWDLYPNAKEILLVRDVRDMLCSIFAFNKQRGFDAFGRESTSSDEEFVSQLGKTYDQIVATWHARSDRAHLLRYEDLILKPTETLADILRYLNVDASAATIQGMLDSVAEDSAVQADHRTAGSPAASVGRWKQDLDPKLRDLCLEVCGSSMAALGYE